MRSGVTWLKSQQQLVFRFYEEVLNEKRLEVLDELLSEDFVEHGTPPIRGRADFRSFVEALLGALPDFRFTVEDWIVATDRVVARASAIGTHEGEFLGYPPTHTPVSWTAIHIWRIADGRLVERWTEADVLGIVSQLQAEQPTEP
jgi:steroid delta-isomerase-like uncharacterized protein